MLHRKVCPVIVAMMVGVLLLASCSTTPAIPATSGTSPTGTKPYGSLTFAGPFAGSGTIDPVESSTSAHYGVNVAIFDSLVELAPDAKVGPGIAERWEIAPDGLTQTFYIRRGVKFHNGDDLTGADVKFSLDRMKAPESTMHAAAAQFRSAIARVELKDDYTVVLHLNSPRFELLEAFSSMGGGTAVVPKKYIEEKGVEYFRKNPIGSGPWRLVSYIRGDRLELEAVESHWREVPKFRTITHLIVPDESSKVAMLKTGEVDLAEVSVDSVPGLKSAGLRIYVHDGGGQATMYLFWDLDQPGKYPLGDVRVRKALSLGIDRKEMANKLYGGYAEPMAVSSVARTAYFFDSNVLKPDPYDPEGAKKLLAEAGYPNGFGDLTIWDRIDFNWNTYNLALAGYWNKIGVKAELGRVDYASKLSLMLRATPRPLELYNSIFGIGAGTGGFQFEKMETVYNSKVISFKNIRNLRLDELINKVPATVDPVEKKRLALEAAVLAKNEYSMIPVLHLLSLAALGSKIGGFTPVQQVNYFAAAYGTITHAR